MFDAAGRKKAGSDGVSGDFEQALTALYPFVPPLPYFSFIISTLLQIINRTKWNIINFSIRMEELQRRSDYGIMRCRRAEVNPVQIWI